MSFTVLNVAYPFAPVAPDTAGGAEQVLLALDGALKRAGMNSIVVAPEGSAVSGMHISTPPVRGRIDDRRRMRIHAIYRAAISFALRRLKVDAVHLHGIDFHEYMPADGVPTLVTLHLPLDWYPHSALRVRRARTLFNCVSAEQAAKAPGGFAPGRVIENGVDCEAFGAPVKRRAYAMTLGRICPEKGIHLAIDAARAAGVPFVLAGEVFPYRRHEEYFSTEILTRIGPGCRYAGKAGPSRKRRLLAGAMCLVVASTVAETSSLVAMEALASGTPVVAFRKGALAGIVEHGKTGFLADDTDEMARRIPECQGLSSDDCRAAARERFPLTRMAEAYMGLYRELASMDGRAGA